MLAHGPARAAEAAATPDVAASDGAGASAVDEVVVTARRREEKLEDVPITVSAVSGQVLTAERLDRVADYAAKLPNFTAVQQNTRVSTLTIRGAGGNANSDGSEAGVGLIVDNVFFTHPGFSWLDFVDLDHIEIARGPQGTLLGKNTAIGALIVTAKLPSFTPETTVEATAANHDRYELRANISGPLIGDKLAGRLTFYDDTGGGYITNDFNGQKLLDNHRWSVRGQLLFEYGGFTDRLIAEHYSSRELNNYYPALADPLTYANGTARNGWERRLLGLGYTPSFDLRQGASLDDQQRLVSRTDGVSNEANYVVNGFTLTSVTAWRRLYFRPYNDSDGMPLPIFRAGYDVDVNQYSQEFRIASPAGRTFDYQAGVYLLKQDVTSNYRTQFQADASGFFLSPLLPSVILNGVEADQLGKAETKSGAIYGQGTYRFTDRASLTAGLRYTHEEKDASNDAFSFGGAALPAALAPYRAAVTGAPYLVSAEKTSDAVSWLINPAYKVTEDILAYVSVSYGEKSGAANLGAKPGDRVIISPEKSTDYELGLKTTLLGGKAALNADLYWDDIDDYQATLGDPTTGRSYLANVGKVVLRGLEIDGRIQLTERLSLSGSGTLSNSEYASYKNAPPPPELTYAGAPLSVDLSGKQLAFAPRYSGNLSVRYDQPIAGGRVLFGYLNEVYRGATALNPLSQYGRQSAYGVTNAGIGLHSADERWRATLWSKNLFDKRYNIASAAASAYTPYIAILGDPRTFGVTLTAKVQ